GHYLVCEVAQATWTQSAPDNTKCAAGSPTLADGGFAVTITSGSSEPNNNFGNFQQGTKSGVKFEDEDADGLKETGDALLPGWTINAYADTESDGLLDLTDYQAGAAATDDTDANGAYSLSLNPGKYVVCEESQTGFKQS